ncbi:hypothetical protein AB4391_08075 [Vibrio lentus]|uniref:Uncharacterized protein n=1 Tax=Vibrio lentus TaxID=136468 RepID=A0A2N7K2R8_9VIBR|nr:hypothetical protein [Vibrio lentus]PMM68301.1 hypothetical protein BCT49_08920 [Vibrio lentus]
MFQLSNPPQASSSSGSVGEVGANVLACIPLSAQDGGSASGFVTILNNLYDDPERSHNAALYHRNESINGEWGRRMQLKSAVDLITKAEPYDSVSLMMSVTLKGKINLDASTAAKVSALDTPISCVIGIKTQAAPSYRGTYCSVTAAYSSSDSSLVFGGSSDVVLNVQAGDVASIAESELQISFDVEDITNDVMVYLEEAPATLENLFGLIHVKKAWIAEEAVYPVPD